MEPFDGMHCKEILSSAAINRDRELVMKRRPVLSRSSLGKVEILRNGISDLKTLAEGMVSDTRPENGSAAQRLNHEGVVLSDQSRILRDDYIPSLPGLNPERIWKGGRGFGRWTDTDEMIPEVTCVQKQRGEEGLTMG